MRWGRRNGRAGRARGGGQVQIVAQGYLPSGEVIRIRDSVAPGVLAAGLLSGKIEGVGRAVAQGVHAGRHAVGIGREFLLLKAHLNKLHNRFVGARHIAISLTACSNSKVGVAH